jgi:hypothetical protein
MNLDASENFSAIKEKFSLASRFMIGPRAFVVLGDVNSAQPKLSILNNGIAIS